VHKSHTSHSQLPIIIVTAIIIIIVAVIVIIMGTLHWLHKLSDLWLYYLSLFLASSELWSDC